MKFYIEQVALFPADPAAAKRLLKAMGAQSWVKDRVTATGKVYEQGGVTNVAELHFNYDTGTNKPLELEILDYQEGSNWMDDQRRGFNQVSHFGMHCTAYELVRWRKFFTKRKIGIAQQVFTTKHTNPAIAGKRRYNYVIFDTKAILGVDLKFIVRIEV